MTESRRRWILRPRTFLTILGLLTVVGLIAIGFSFFQRNTGSSTRLNYDVVFPRRDSIVATVNATGQMQPRQVVNLSFVAPGRVAEVFVDVGDQVSAGEALARLETRELEIRVAQAEAQLQQAKANYEQLVAGASPEEVAAAEAQVRQAQAQYRQTSGSVTQADIQAAEAQLRQAEEQLRQLQAGPKNTDVRTAEAQLQQAQAQLETQRDQLSAAKTNAQFQIDQSVNTLTQAQSRYATALQNWQYVQDTGNDPIRPSLGTDPRGNDIANKLNDAQRQQYYDALVQSEATLRSAEQAVEQAKVGFETARQNEINGLQVAEQQVTTAQASLDRLQAGADTDQVAGARAQVASARANLNKLRGDQRSGALQAAQAGIEQAQANLERVSGGATQSDLTAAQAQVQSAQAGLDLANLSLEQATLTAPFDGTIAEVNLKAGELPTATRAPVVIADLSNYYVDVAVDEVDVSRIQAGQPVTLTLDALPDLRIPAEVASIAPLSAAQSAVTSYQVRLTSQAADPRVRSGMSTNADIEVAKENNVLLVPRRAVRNDRGRLVVETPIDQSICTLPPEQRPPDPERRQIEVETGLSNEQVIQITSQFDEQTCVYVEGLDSRFNILGGPPGARNRN
jgi:HlyD family secretion protein